MLALLCGIVLACVNAVEGIVRARCTLCLWASAIEFPGNRAIKTVIAVVLMHTTSSGIVLLSITAKIRFLCKLLRHATDTQGTRSFCIKNPIMQRCTT